MFILISVLYQVHLRCLLSFTLVVGDLFTLGTLFWVDVDLFVG